MRSKTGTDNDLGKLVLEGMLIVFTVLIFLFIVQNWVLTSVGDTQFAPVCNLANYGLLPEEQVQYGNNSMAYDY